MERRIQRLSEEDLSNIGKITTQRWKMIPKDIVRILGDYSAGIQFRDITSITENATAFKQSITELSVHVAKFNADCIVGIESRGFVFGTPIATKFDLYKFILARKEQISYLYC